MKSLFLEIISNFSIHLTAHNTMETQTQWKHKHNGLRYTHKTIKNVHNDIICINLTSFYLQMTLKF